VRQKEKHTLVIAFSLKLPDGSTEVMVGVIPNEAEGVEG
jgi:hypothetical protein